MTGLSRLQKLGLAWNKGVTDAVVEMLCGSVSGLKELDLTLCDNITGRSLRVCFRDVSDVKGSCMPRVFAFCF